MPFHEAPLDLATRLTLKKVFSGIYFPFCSYPDALPMSGIRIIKLPLSRSNWNVALLFCHRAFPSSKPCLCCEGCWDMQLPPRQPGFARKCQTLCFSAGSVRSCCSGGESHSPGESSAFRFNASLSVLQPHQPPWPQVSAHRTSAQAVAVPIYIFVQHECAAASVYYQ